MTILNILSVKKTKVHGMKSRRWTVKDKLNQYKGIINLHERDKNIVKKDSVEEESRLRYDNHDLIKEIHKKRVDLINAILGDKQRLRNTLAEHKDLQLAFQNCSITKVIEHVKQQNFYKKKQLCKINFTMRKKTEKLMTLKLQHADLLDRIEFESLEKIPVEIKVQTVFGQIQDAILKQEAARAVSQIYKKILTILKKDAIYYDAVLAALQIDGYNQAKCIYAVTEMGQLATEYADDRRIEYSIIEKDIQHNMIIREKSIKEVTDNLQNVTNEMKFLIRHDSVTELSEAQRVIDMSKTETKMLVVQISNIEETLDYLRQKTLVDKIEDIYPRLVDTLDTQSKRLQNLLKTNTANRDILLNKVRHGEEMYYNYLHSMVETTFQYKSQKRVVINKINEKLNERKMIHALIKRRTQTILNARIALQQILEMLRVVILGDAKSKMKKKKSTIALIGTTIRPEYLESNVFKIIDGIIEKLNVLISHSRGHEATPSVLMPEYYEKFIFQMTGKSQITEIKTRDAVLGDMDLTLVKDVPTREELKKYALVLVEHYKKIEEMMGLG